MLSREVANGGDKLKKFREALENYKKVGTFRQRSRLDVIANQLFHGGMLNLLIQAFGSDGIFWAWVFDSPQYLERLISLSEPKDFAMIFDLEIQSEPVKHRNIPPIKEFPNLTMLFVRTLQIPGHHNNIF